MEVLKDHPHVTTVVKSISEKQGFKNFAIDDVTSNRKGEGFSGFVFFVKVKDGASDKQLNLAIKLTLTNEKIRSTEPVLLGFENEVNFYVKVLPLMKEFQRERGVSGKVQFVPRYFGVSMEDMKEMLVLENLRTVGFELFDKKSFLDHDHIGVIFKTYGRFHALSFAMRDQRPEQFDNLVKDFPYLNDVFVREGNSFFKEMLQGCGKLIRNYLKPGEEDAVIGKFEKLYGGDEMRQVFKDLMTDTCEYSAILHGDCWSNNMMFKYEETGNSKKVTDVLKLSTLQMKLISRNFLLPCMKQNLTKTPTKVLQEKFFFTCVK